MADYTLYSHGLAIEALTPVPQTGYLSRYEGDENSFGYRSIRFTDDQTDALTFATARAAMDFWRQVSVTVPVRPDGQPNRPLTQFTVELVPVGESPTLPNSPPQVAPNEPPPETPTRSAP